MEQRSDADLVAAWRSGDREAFADVYRRYADLMFGVAVGLVGDRSTAADVVHDTFVRAAGRVATLREPDRLRAWLLAILRNEAIDVHRRSRRERAEDVTEMTERTPADIAEPHLGPARGELAEVIWSAADALQPRDRELLELHVRGGLEAGDLAQVLGVAAGHAAVLLSRMRDRMEKAIGALLVARLGRRGCPVLDTSLAGWDGRFTLAVRTQVTRHIESCQACTGERSRLATYQRLAPAMVPPLVAPAELWHRTSADVPLSGAPAGPVAGSPSPSGYAVPQPWEWHENGFPHPRASLPDQVPPETTTEPAPDDAPTPRGDDPGVRTTVGAAQPVPRSTDLFGNPLPPAAAALAVRSPASDDLVRRRRAGAALAGLVVLLLIGVGTMAWRASTSDDTSRLMFVPPSSPGSAAAESVGVATSAPVSQQVSPSTAAASPSGTGLSSTRPTTTSTTTSPTSSTTSSTHPTTPSHSPSVTPSRSPLPSPRPAHLSLSTSALDLGSGAEATTATAVVSDDGGQATSWTTDVTGAGLTVSPSSGTLPAGGKVTLTVTLTRAGLPEGSVDGSVTVTAASIAQSLPITLSGAVVRPPVITKVTTPSVSIGAVTVQCLPLRGVVTAVVTDPDGAADLTSVSLTWNDGKTAHTVAMAATAAGPRAATVGPFATSGSFPASITATDAHGYTATADVTIAVVACT